jgi:hypothetical protein
MTGRHLEAITLTVAHAEPYLLPWMICRAYARGATLAQVLLSIEAGRCLTTEPSCGPVAEWATAHDWAWISRRLPPRWPSRHRR